MHKQVKEYGDLAHSKVGLPKATYNPLGRNKRSVWEVSPTSYRGAHFAVMPDALIEPCILAGSKKDDVVLDPFSGTGTTLCVALKHGRRYIGIELDPDSVALAKSRIATVQPMLLT